MKVLHVIPSISLAHGGPSQVIRTMARGLAQRGIDVHVATTDDDGPHPRLTVPLGTAVPQEDGATYWYFRRSTRFYKASLPMSRWLSRHVADYDLVHIHALFSYTPAAAAYYADRRRVPYIVRPLGVLNRWGVTQGKPTLKKLSIALVERRIVQRAARMHYTSDAEQEEAESLGLAAPCVILPNPVEGPGHDLPHHAYPGLEGREVILFLSRVSPKKGLDLLLNAYAQLRRNRPQTALVIAGSGDDSYLQTLKQQEQQLGLQGHITWTGFVTGDAKWNAFAGADLFVLPSYSENFGVAPVEAMAAGVPVIVSDQVGIHPEITRSGSGAVVTCDADTLCRAMDGILRHPNAATAMRERGKQYAEKHYSVPAVARQLEDLYTQVLEEKRRGAEKGNQPRRP